MKKETILSEDAFTSRKSFLSIKRDKNITPEFKLDFFSL